MSSTVKVSDAIATTADRVGMIALCTFAFFQIASKTVSLVALLVMLLCIVVDIRRLGAAISRNTVARLTLVVALYIALWAVISSWRQPHLAHANFHRLPDWLTLLLFPLVAWFTRGQTRRVLIVLALSLPGMLIGMAEIADWHRVAQAWANPAVRAHWGVSIIEHAFYLGIGLLGWIALAGRIIGRGSWRWLRAIGWIVVAALLSEMLFLTQSRNALLSLAMITPIVTLAGLLHLARTGRKKQALVYSLVLVLGVSVLAATNMGRVANRYDQTQRTLHEMKVQHDLTNTSVGYRLQLYKLGAEAWLQHPLMGWGPGYEASEMHAGAPTVGAANKHFDHLHDGYIEILVRFGLIGFVLIGVLALVFCRDFFRAWRRGAVPFDIGLMLVSASALGALVNLATMQLVHKPYAFAHVILLGLMLGYLLDEQSRNTAGHTIQNRAPSPDGTEWLNSESGT